LANSLKKVYIIMFYFWQSIFLALVFVFTICSFLFLLAFLRFSPHLTQFPSTSLCSLLLVSLTAAYLHCLSAIKFDEMAEVLFPVDPAFMNT
jgi:hypothetical protein